MARIATIQHISPIAAQSVIRDSTVSAVSVATVEVSHFSVLRLPGQQRQRWQLQEMVHYLDTATAVTVPSTGYTIVV